MQIFCSILFLVHYNKADFSGEGTWASAPGVRTDYKYRLTTLGDPSKALAGLETYWAAYYRIDLKVEPCADFTLTGGRGSACCSNTGEVNCQDTSQGIVAGPDMQIAYFQNAHVATCEGTIAEDDPNCGTFIEIHRSDTDAVLADVQIFNTNGAYQTAYIATEGLCAGDYSLWWVVRTRSGPYVQYQKNFEIVYPSCPV